MQVYFSHSYRDVEINTYFFGVLVEQELELFADQKSPTWCVAKLERYLHDLSGFLSIVPRRATEDGSITYSPYIGYELSLARRSRLPRLIFVDDELLNRYRDRFPTDAIPFVRSSPASDRFRHIDAIREFRKALADRGTSGKEKISRSVRHFGYGGWTRPRTGRRYLDGRFAKQRLRPPPNSAKAASGCT
jgi:hypothetical protein